MKSVILVETAGSVNIGMVARAMMNTRNQNLLLVNPQCDLLGKDALTYAIHARPLLEKAQIFNTLTEALSDSDFSVAMTRRAGKKRHTDFILSELPTILAAYSTQNIALVFGSEDKGLSKHDIEQCNLTCSIPSDSEFPSLNLAQSVMVTLYELYAHSVPIAENSAAPAKVFDEMMESIMLTLDTMHYFNKTNPGGLEYVLQKILHRAFPNERECAIIKNMFQRINGHYLHALKKKE